MIILNIEMKQDIEKIDRENDMRILVLGAGVLGCNLAKNLSVGNEVTLLARGKWGEEIRRNGLKIKNRFLPFTSLTHISVINQLDSGDTYDVIFVVVRYTQINSVAEVLQENMTKNIIFVGNNVRCQATAELFPKKNVLFAFTSAAGYRDEKRVVSVDLAKITIGPVHGGYEDEVFIKKIFSGTKYNVHYEPYMADYLLCHASFVLPVVFACYRTCGNMKKLRGNKNYLNMLVDANIEGYRAIQKAGYRILPEADQQFEGKAYRKTCLRFFHLLCTTPLGNLCVCDHAMHAIDEMSALNKDIKNFFDVENAPYPIWQKLEEECQNYLQ